MSSKHEPEPDVLPVLAEHVESSHPPPSYEEVFGQYVTSVQHSQPEPPSLAYIDILPRLLSPGNIQGKMPPVFQKFSDIVSGANVWLKDNPDVSVWRCETVERKVEAGKGDSPIFVDLDSTVYRQSAFGFNCYVFGLRLWLCQAPSGRKVVQELGLLNVMPTKKKVDVTFFHRHGLGRRSYAATTGQVTVFEGLKKSLGDFNNTIQENGIPGTVLTIESTFLKFAESFQFESTDDVADAGSWHEQSAASSKRYTQILRVYYVKGPVTKPEIKMAEILPTQLSQPTMSTPAKFSKFDDVINQTAAWMKQQTGVRVVSVETRDAPVKRHFNGTEIDTDTTDDVQLSFFSNTRLRFLRIFYISDPSSPPLNNMCVTSRLFVPASLGGTRFESMVQTMHRIDAWLKVTKLPILAVETVVHLATGSALGVDADSAQYNLKTTSGKHWVSSVRVYFPTAFQEPPASLLPPPPAKGNGKSSSCTLL